MTLPRSLLVVVAVVVTLAAVARGVAGPAASAAAPPLPGGSNYSWYQVGRPQRGVCNREPYGVVPNFNAPAAQAKIEAQLGEMIQSGQRRLRIGLFFRRGPDDGTIMDATGGDLSAQNRSNLADLLGAIKDAGFAEVEIAFHPQPPNLPQEWTAWDEQAFQENWNLIQNLRPIIRAAGLPYRIDLTNEAMPRPDQPLLLEYSRRLWENYTRAFGRDDTVGFSVGFASITDDVLRISQMPTVYGDAPPDVFDVHFYGTRQAGEYGLFRAVDDRMRQLGLTQPWIVGEAFYNDPMAAAQLQAAIADTRRPVHHLMQWPLTRGSACADVDVAAPTSFDAYDAAGFGSLPPPRARPLPTLTGRKLVVGRGGRLALGVRCGRAATRCTGTVALRLRTRVVNQGRFSVFPGETAVLRARLPRATRGALRRSGRLRATVILKARSAFSAGTTRRALRVVLVSA